LVRALQTGCTANEILDAILHAFPALGLAKIVWAMDIVLDMDIPEFRAENLGAEKRWHTVKAETEIPEGQITYCDSDGRSLFVYRENGGFHVYDSRCPHQVTNIPHLALEGRAAPISPARSGHSRADFSSQRTLTVPTC
jgi:hypothetical protein